MGNDCSQCKRVEVKTLLAQLYLWKLCPSNLFFFFFELVIPLSELLKRLVSLTASRTMGFLLCAFTNSVLSFQLAYCVVQFMEKDATVTEYVRFLQCLINA